MGRVVRSVALGGAVAAVLVLAGPGQAVRLDGPSIAQHDAITTVATYPCGQTACTNIFYTLDVTGGTPPYILQCGLNSGGVLTVGSFHVQCTALDSRGSSSPPMIFDVTILPLAVDTTPPVMQNVPGDITATATSPSGIAVMFTRPTALDTVDGPIQPSCDHNGGDVFPVGTTTVTCTAADGHNNVATASFRITVTGPSSGSSGSSGSGSSGSGSSGSGSSGSSSGSGSSGSGSSGSSGSGSSGSSFSPDVTGCTESTCMSNSISLAQLDGCDCDFGSFNWNKTSYTLQNAGHATIAPTLTIETGNQTNDVAVSFEANGSPIDVASTAASGQQSGIYYNSKTIALKAGVNVITISVTDPLHKLNTTDYTFTFAYTPTGTGSSGAAASSSSSGPASSGSGSSAPSSSGSSAGPATPVTATATVKLSPSDASAPPAQFGANRLLAGALSKAMHRDVVLTKATKCSVGTKPTPCWKILRVLATAKRVTLKTKPSTAGLTVTTLRLVR